MALIWFRIAAGIIALLALGFGIPGLLGALHFQRTGEVWRLWGFPTYGPGTFEKWGIPLSAALMVAFSAVCALALGAAVLMWLPETALVGAIAALVLLLAQAVFWIGFELPFGPPLGIAAVVLIVLGFASPAAN
jgi:prepilin signal peptidase PulO-like enzyme (type II secretory pathway)